MAGEFLEVLDNVFKKLRAIRCWRRMYELSNAGMLKSYLAEYLLKSLY